MINLPSIPLTFNTEISVFHASNGRPIVYLPLKGKAFWANARAESIIDKIKTGDPIGNEREDGDVLKWFSERGLFGPSEYATPHTPNLTSFSPSEATLIFTETCNLDCSYCYSNAHAVKSKAMGEELMRAAVDFVCANAANAERSFASFRFIGGGEPTVEWSLLERTTRYIQESAVQSNVQYFIRLITNGTLLTKKRIAWISEHLQFVTLSFDILPDLQAKRPFSNGVSSHDRLVEVVHELDDKQVPYHLRTTISEDSSSRLEEMVHYVYENFRTKSIRFEPLSSIGRSVKRNVGKPAEAAFVESFKKAYRTGKRFGIDVTCKMFTNLARRSSRFCDAEFAITPTGAVSGCHRYSKEEHEGYSLFKIGDFKNAHFSFDLKQINRLRSIDVHTFEQCSTCIAKWTCASGCLSARCSKEGVRGKGPLCKITTELLKFSIEEKLGGQSNDRKTDM